MTFGVVVEPQLPPVQFIVAMFVFIPIVPLTVECKVVALVVPVYSC